MFSMWAPIHGKINKRLKRSSLRLVLLRTVMTEKQEMTEKLPQDDVTCKGNVVSGTECWDRKRTWMEHRRHPHEVWNLVKCNLSVSISWLWEMCHNKVRCDNGGLLRGMWELTVLSLQLLWKSTIFQNKKFIKSIKTVSKRVYIWGVRLPCET